MNAAPGAAGIIAGGGGLPLALAEHLRISGRSYYIIRLAGIADPNLAEHPGEEQRIGAFGAVVAALRNAGCTQVTLAGLVQRPDFMSLRPDLRGAQALPRILAAAAAGDDALLRAIAVEFESEGFTVVGAEAMLDSLLTPVGVLGAHEPDAQALADIERASRVVTALGMFDAGQGAVVCAGLVLAVEAQEGTDLMLARVMDLPVDIRGTETARRGVLVKQPKPGQERRVDLPVIGPVTVEGAARAGLGGIALAAGGSLIVNRARTVAAADAAGLFLYGFDEAETASG